MVLAVSRRPGFCSSSVNVGFVLDKVALGQVSLRLLQSVPVSIIEPMVRTQLFTCHRHYVTLAIDSVVK